LPLPGVVLSPLLFLTITLYASLLILLPPTLTILVAIPVSAIATVTRSISILLLTSP